MTDFRSDFMQVMAARGFLHQCTDPEALDEAARSGSLTAYIGFDATAPSLHVGSLMMIMMLRHLQRCGHRPIVLMGGATSMVGDPSFRDDSRVMLEADTIAQNMAGIQRVFKKFLDFNDGPNGAIEVDNLNWLAELDYLPFLRNIGQHFSVNRMLSFDSVKLRLDRQQPLSFLEFNYMILQAYDFLVLNREFGCTLQMGGSDQWGNIVNGIDLTRRVDQQNVFGLTSELITTASGTKMGKTAQGAVWLNEAQLSSYDYWQFWRNTDDADVVKFLKLFTDLPLNEIAKLSALSGAEINEAKKILANEATTLAHGSEAAVAAERTAQQTFEQEGIGEALPVVEISRATLENGLPAFILFSRAGLAASNGEAKRLIKGGGARVNDAKITDESEHLTLANMTEDGVIKLSAGKKRHALIRPI